MTDWLSFAVVSGLYWGLLKHREQQNQQQQRDIDEEFPFKVSEYCEDHPILSHKWTDYTTEQEQFVRWAPKIELHVHLDGSFDQVLLYERLLARGEAHHCLPVHTVLPWDQSVFPVRELVQSCRTAKDYHTLCTCRGKQSLHEMLKCFELFLPVVRGRLALLEVLAYDFCQRQAQQHIVYTEVRYSPHLLASHGHMFVEDDDDNDDDDEQETTNDTTTPGSSTPHQHSDNKNNDIVDARPVLDAVTRGLRRGCREFGICVNQILCMIAWRPEWAMNVVELAQERRSDYPCAVVGVDVAAGEEHFDKTNFPHLHHPHATALKRAHGLGLNITLHAGETESPQNVLTAIESYHATRIGHGYRLLQQPELIAKLPSDLHLEVCPTSSVETGGWQFMSISSSSSSSCQTQTPWTDHPAVHLYRTHRIKMSLNSDDPAVFDTSLTWQWRMALGKMGLTMEEVLQMNKSAIDAAFCSLEDKLRLHNVVNEYWETRVAPALLKQHSFSDRVGGNTTPKRRTGED